MNKSQVFLLFLLSVVFGLAAVFAGITAVWVSIASFRYEQAIPIAASNVEAINLTFICFFLVILKS